MPAIEPDGYDKQHILVDHVRNSVGVATIVLTSMVEQ